MSNGQWKEVKQTQKTFISGCPAKASSTRLAKDKLTTGQCNTCKTQATLNLQWACILINPSQLENAIKYKLQFSNLIQQMPELSLACLCDHSTDQMPSWAKASPQSLLCNKMFPVHAID